MKEKVWEVEFSCGMVGCSKDSFINDVLPKMTDVELMFILNEITFAYTKIYVEYRKRNEA